MSKATIVKPKRHEHIGESRRAQLPEIGDRVEYPVPFPPVSHNERGGKTYEVARPTGDEEWFPAKVVAVEHHPHSISPDDYLVALKPDDQLPITLSAVFVRSVK